MNTNLITSYPTPWGIQGRLQDLRRRWADEWTRLARTIQRPIHGTLIIPPASPGSVGDEACLNALAGNLNESDIGIASYKGDDNWNHVNSVSRSHSFARLFDSPSLSSLKAALSILRRYQRVVLVGTDVLDGDYDEWRSLARILLIESAVRMGVNINMTGISVRRKVKPNCKLAFRRLPVGFKVRVRDKNSKERLDDILDHPTELVADIAFLLKPVISAQPNRDLVDWIKSQKSENRLVIGINVNHLLLDKTGVSIENLIGAFQNAICEFHRKDSATAFVLLPHDERLEWSDLRIAEELQTSLANQGLKDCVTCLRPPLRACEIKAVVSHLDFVISGKMHLAIACLGSGTPVGCITYQDKFEGLFAHFGIEGVFVSPRSAGETKSLLDLMERVLARKEQLKQQIIRRLPSVIELSSKNLEM